MSLQKFTDMFVFALLLLLIGGMVTILSYNMLPPVIQAGNDLVNEDISGVALTTSQSNTVTASQTMTILIFLWVGVIVMVVGIILLIYTAFKGMTTGK